MSLDYFYVNRDKRQFFPVGLPDTNSRFGAVGTGRGARALALLLSERGAWRGDRIALVSDTDAEFEELVARGADIRIEAELAVLAFGGLEQLESELDSCSSSFERMCAYALILGHKAVTAMLDQKFGQRKWQLRYEQSLQSHPTVDQWTQRVIDAKNRGLTLV